MKSLALKTLLLTTLSATGAQAAIVDIDWTLGQQDNIEINIGDTVRWIWGDPAPHAVVSTVEPIGLSSINSGVLTGAGQEFSQQFNQVGFWQIVCGVHGPSMMTQITVASVPVPAAAWLRRVRPGRDADRRAGPICQRHVRRAGAHECRRRDQGLEGERHH